MCEEHGHVFFETFAPGKCTITPLAPEGKTDTIEANSLDDETLKKLPHIKSIT